MRRVMIALPVLTAIQIAPAAGQLVAPTGDTVIYLDVSLAQCGAQGGTSETYQGTVSVLRHHRRRL